MSEADPAWRSGADQWTETFRTAGPERPNVALGALDAPNATLGRTTAGLREPRGDQRLK
ncbi:hypothetical protein GCM10023192_44030 [Amycolatopsis samaneae]